MSDWTLDGRFGQEIWREAEDRFAPVSVAGRTLERPGDAALLDRLGARDTGCAHPAPLPNAFRFCPRCGESLRDAPPPDRSAPWSPPFGDTGGLPERDLPLLPDPGTVEEIGLPPGVVAIAVAGGPSRLLCCDRSSGWVFAFSRRDADWHRLVRVPPAALPRWSWSAAAGHGGLALPTERGPVWLDLTMAADTPATLPDQPCASLGGPTRLGGAVIAPVSWNGGLAVAFLSGGSWTFLPVSGGEAEAGPFAVPVCGVDSAFWCSKTGQLAVRETGEGFEARFSAWADDVSPLLDARPVAGRDGTLHVQARLDRDTLVWESLFAPNQPRGRRMARGYMPGTGHAVFRENAQLRLPWDERPVCDYPLDDDRFLYPLLCLGENRFVLALCSDRSRLGGFLGDPLFPPPQDAPPVVCTLVFSRGPRMLEPLDCVLRAHRASDLSATVHGRFLMVHGAIENRCFRWELRDES
ncbi:hypothetical protein NFI95_13355 [Acetobacteraceae bacterium KSS8]|uniref:Uncharacterized protein n=1 Tax=Endosaccharibacter trunci TaxID=2812733 RepID=A0ABT1W958_9PROT|nr:hypothetical protein [Acetobacteraceae bacterium KSS8]